MWEGTVFRGNRCRHPFANYRLKNFKADFNAFHGASFVAFQNTFCATIYTCYNRGITTIINSFYRGYANG